MSGHLVHGMGKTLEAPTWPTITHDEADAVVARFSDAGHVKTLNWHSPRPFSAAALLQTDRGEFILKRHAPQLRSVAALGEEHAFMAHLRLAGLSVPDVLTDAHGATALQEGAWTYELHRKASGVDLYRDAISWTPFFDEDHVFASGVALARLHQAARGFATQQRGPHPLVSSFTILPADDPLAAAEQYIAQRPAIADYLVGKPWREQLTHAFATFGTGLPNLLKTCTPVWTNNDWHPSNLLWSTDASSVTTIIDFGLSSPSCAHHDIAFAIERTAIAWLDLGSGVTDIATDIVAALRLLEGYRTVSPLCVRDIETVLRLLPLVHIEFALSEVDYFAGILNDPEQASMAWDDYAIGHVDWFASPHGQAFLQELKSKAMAL